MPLDNVWLVLLFNVTFILAFSWAGWTILHRQAQYSKVSKSNVYLSNLTIEAPKVYVKWYLSFRRLIKRETDDDLPYELLSFTV